MVNRQHREQEDMFLNALYSIKPDPEEFINRRIHHINFARTIFWLCVRSREDDFVYAKQLADFLRVSMQRSLSILNDLSSCAKILIKKFGNDGSIAEYWFALDGNVPRVRKYFDVAIKTLGIKKFKLDIEKEKTEVKRLHKSVEDDAYF